MRVLICGSRDWTLQEPIYRVLNGYLHDGRADHDTPLTIISGGASGADQIAERWATLNNVDRLIHKARWDQHGNAAGPIRNQEMLAAGEPDTVWAFATKPLRDSVGTADMVRRATRAGVPTFLVQTGPMSLREPRETSAGTCQHNFALRGEVTAFGDTPKLELVVCTRCGIQKAIQR